MGVWKACPKRRNDHRERPVAALQNAKGVCSLLSYWACAALHNDWWTAQARIYLVKPSIAAAAIRVGERIFTGETHVEASAKLVRAPKLGAEEKVQMILAGEPGFITDDGQFVNSDEAHEISRNAGVVEMAERRKKLFHGALVDHPYFGRLWVSQDMRPSNEHWNAWNASGKRAVPTAFNEKGLHLTLRSYSRYRPYTVINSAQTPAAPPAHIQPAYDAYRVFWNS